MSLVGAATVPLVAPAALFGAGLDAGSAASPRSVPIVLAQTQPLGDPRVTTSSATPTAISAGTSAATPTGSTRSTSDDRWWRAQLDRLATTSVVNVPPPVVVGPAPPLERFIPPAIESSRTAPIPPAVAPTPIAPAREVVPTEPRLSPNVPAAIRRWEPLILRAARRQQVDPNLVAALMLTESGGDPNAVSPMHAIGLMQVLDGPTDPEANIEQGVAMLAGHLRRFGAVNLALAAYNAGPNAVASYGGIPPYQETQTHVARTLASYVAFRGG